MLRIVSLLGCWKIIWAGLISHMQVAWNSEKFALQTFKEERFWETWGIAWSFFEGKHQVLLHEWASDHGPCGKKWKFSGYCVRCSSLELNTGAIILRFSQSLYMKPI